MSYSVIALLGAAVLCCVACERPGPPPTTAMVPTEAHLDAGPAEAGDAAVPDAARPDAAPSASSGKTLFVREKKVDCETEGPTKCMEVRENESEEWRLFYGRIEGFVHEDGYRYTLLVTTDDAAPRADGRKKRYRLKEIVHKEKASTP